MSSFRPKSRTEEKIVQEVNDEVLVYDIATRKAHCLNSTAAIVWRTCDGALSESEIAATIKLQTGMAISAEVVSLAVAQLLESGLIEESDSVRAGYGSRRELLRRVAASALVSLPIVSTVVIPQSALAAGSVCPVASTCFCSGRSSNGGTCFSPNCPTGCICGELIGCNPGGNHCRGVCIV